MVYQRFMDCFFSKENIRNTLIVLCQNNPHEADPISNTIIIILTTPLEIQLIANGIQLFKDKGLIYPYQYMNSNQREFLLEIINMDSKNWLSYEFCLQWKCKGAPMYVDHLEILKTLCELIQGSKKYTDARSKLAITNIILQRVHANVTISKTIQLSLNKFLFAE